MKKISIKMAILIPSLSVLMAGIVIMVAVIGVISSRSAKDLTSRLMDASVNQYSNEFRALCQDVYGAVSASTPIISNYIDPAFAEDVTDPRSEVINILSKAMLSNEKIVAMWTCWEPNAFDGKDTQYADTSFYDASGRFVPYVYNKGSDVIVEALVNYDHPVEGDYYQGARNSMKPYMTDPYAYKIDGKEMFIYSLAFPIIQNGQVLGVVGADIHLQEAITIMNAGRILSDGYLFTLSPSGLFATHSNDNLLMTSYNTTWMKNYSAKIDALLKNGGNFSANAYSDITNTFMTFRSHSVMIGETGRYWLVCGVVPETTANASSTSLLQSIIAIGIILVVIMGITMLFIVRNRLKGLHTLTDTADAIALGDITSIDLSAHEQVSKNEITLLGQAFSRMMDGIHKQADTLTRISEGDYTMTLPIRSDQDVMNQSINHMLENTNHALSQINLASGQVNTGASQIAVGSQSLAQGATEQASAVEELSNSIGEIAGRTDENAKMATKAAQLSLLVKDKAEQGSTQMQDMMHAVKSINDASQNISKVIKVIDEIAFQTNLLALNASVEAARAGHNGKGFAVVAEEVRNLASKSAQAAKNTSSLIEDSISKAELGVRLADQTAKSLNEIVAGVNETTTIVERIAHDSQEQSLAINQINHGIDQVAQVVQNNSATSEESAASSQEMSGQAAILTDLVGQFHLKDEYQTNRQRLSSSSVPQKITDHEKTFPLEGYGKY